MGTQSYLIHLVKAQNFHSAVGVLDQGRQTFDPIAIVAVQNAVDIANFSVVNMSAHHAIESVFGRLGGHGHFKVIDETDGLFDFELEVGRQRPIGQTKFGT